MVIKETETVFKDDNTFECKEALFYTGGCLDRIKQITIRTVLLSKTNRGRK